MHILPLFSHYYFLKRVSLWKSLDLDYVLEQGDKIFEDKKLYEYLAVAHESLLLAENNNLFQNYRHYSESDRGNGAIFTYFPYCVATKWAENNLFLFDSHSRNTYGLHDPNGQAVL